MALLGSLVVERVAPYLPVIVILLLIPVGLRVIEYLRRTRCPNCGGDRLLWYLVDLDTNLIVCKQCGHRWHDA